jgi:predicted nucleotidyltransferase
MTYYPRILNRVLSQALTASRQQRSMSHSLKAVPDAANVEDLRALAGPVFAIPDFRDIQWAGVFGSFASGTQTPESDVDVVVYQKALTEELSPGRLYLEDVLPRVWNRRVDIIRVEDDEFRGYVSIESLLCSRTVYGSARDEEVLRLRRRASKTLDSGRQHYVGILKETEQVKSMIEGISEEVSPLSIVSEGSRSV